MVERLIFVNKVYKENRVGSQLGLIIFNPVAQHALIVHFIVVAVSNTPPLAKMVFWEPIFQSAAVTKTHSIPSFLASSKASLS